MTYFEDLSGYSYSGVDTIPLDRAHVTFRPQHQCLNVGWLDHAHPFPTGAVPAGFTEALLSVTAGDQVNVMRGFHICQFCPESAEDHMLTAEHQGQRVWMGHAEIRVPGRPGVMFAAPTLIWHYIDQHGYQPPAAFIDAVMAYDAIGMTDPTRGWLPADAETDAF